MTFQRRLLLVGCLTRTLSAWTLFAPSLDSSDSDFPKELAPPEGQILLFNLKGRGHQIYQCQNVGNTYQWKLKAPEAELLDKAGNPAGKHFAGPTWQASDGSRVVGKLAASVSSPPAAKSIPWLLLTATLHEGTGTMTKVQSIQRLDTKAGLPPTSSCTAGNDEEEKPVAYQATYLFYGAP